MTFIKRREFLAGAAASFGAASLGVGCSKDDPTERSSGSSTRRQRQPNVLYITADDLGTTLGVYGDEQVHSPNIDGFADRSLLFERCYCQIAICWASRTSILTGLRPETTGLLALQYDWRAELPDTRSLPGAFRDGGYHTVGLGKIFDDRGGGSDDCWDEGEERGGVADSELAIDHLEALAQEDDPFFLAVGFSQPHCPWTPTDAAAAQYDPAAIELLGPGRDFGAMQECAGATAPIVSDAEAREITARYYAETTDVDRAFGEILAAVERLDLSGDTIVIFWSGDHGFHLGQNNLWGKWTCYDCATRVPLLMSVPGMSSAGRRAPGIVECVDMYPTLVELCDLPAPPQQLDGLSFAPLLEDPSRVWKHAAFSVWGFDDFDSQAIKTEQYDYVITQPTFFDIDGNTELFDLATDPTETTNLLESMPEVATVLADHLELGPAAATPDAPPITF